MPAVTTWFIKAGLIHLAAGIFLLLFESVPNLDAGLVFMPVILHMITLGWLTQLIIGVSIWMFPRRDRKKKRLTKATYWWIFWMLNFGLLLRYVSEPVVRAESQAGWAGGLALMAAALQLTAVLLYIVEIWPRVKSKNVRS